ncbi:tetratricopeptide repeat protein [Streptomyces sp. BBFR51]|uniref:tetratricopeptide repeat protein n=1 Tax=Streptomyces sp. BBFR51 TaxID=3372856 RepID=UPI0037DD2AC1
MAKARRHLRALSSASLLTRDADGGYVLHDLVRAYAGELVEQERDDRLLAQTRLLDYLRHNAYTAGRVLDTRPGREPADVPAPGVARVVVDSREDALDWFRREEPAVVAALRSLDDPGLLRHRTTFPIDWGAYYAVQGRWTAEIDVLRLGVEASLRLDDPVAITDNCATLARALAQTGQIEEADVQIELMLGQLDRIDLATRGTAQRTIGWVRGRQGRYTEALHHAREALSIFRALGDRSREAREHNSVGWYLALKGEYREAITACESAVPLLREVGNRRSEAATWDSIGYATQRLGDLDAAVAHYEKSMQLYEEVLDDYNQAEVLDHLASAQLERGETEQAQASWLRAGELFSAHHAARAAEMWAKADTAS